MILRSQAKISLHRVPEPSDIEICVSHLFVGDINRSAEDDPLHHLTAGWSGEGAGVAIVTSQ